MAIVVHLFSVAVIRSTNCIRPVSQFSLLKRVFQSQNEGNDVSNANDFKGKEGIMDKIAQDVQRKRIAYDAAAIEKLLDRSHLLEQRDEEQGEEDEFMKVGQI